MLRELIFGSIVFVALGCGYFAGVQQKSDVSAQTNRDEDARALALVQRLRSEKIVDHLAFDTGLRQFVAIVRKVDAPPVDDSIFKTSQRLTIHDTTGKVVYETTDVAIGGLSVERLLRPDSYELVFSTNGGGTDSNLVILSFERGKFVEIGIEEDLQYRGGYFTLPQYRTGNSGPYFKPSQLILIQQLGGADKNPTASVFRTEKNKFLKIGVMKMQEFGDFIEASIARGRGKETPDRP